MRRWRVAAGRAKGREKGQRGRRWSDGGGGGTAKVGNDHTGIYTFRDSRFPFRFPFLHSRACTVCARLDTPASATNRAEGFDPFVATRPRYKSIRASEFMREILLSERAAFFMGRPPAQPRPIIRKSRVFVIGIVTPAPLPNASKNVPRMSLPNLPGSWNPRNRIPSSSSFFHEFSVFLFTRATQSSRRGKHSARNSSRGIRLRLRGQGGEKESEKAAGFPPPPPPRRNRVFRENREIFRASTRDKTARRSTVICETFRSGAINNGETSKRRGCWVAGGEKRQREGGNSTVMKSSGTSLTPAAFYPPGDHDHDDV